MSKDKKMVPELRFPCFDGEWSAKKLISLSKDGINNGVFNDPKKVGKGYRLINVVNMYEGSSIDIDKLTLLDLEQKSFKKNDSGGNRFWIQTNPETCHWIPKPAPKPALKSRNQPLFDSGVSGGLGL